MLQDLTPIKYSLKMALGELDVRAFLGASVKFGGLP